MYNEYHPTIAVLLCFNCALFLPTTWPDCQIINHWRTSDHLNLSAIDAYFFGVSTSAESGLNPYSPMASVALLDRRIGLEMARYRMQ
jgi:hypothetical protein